MSKMKKVLLMCTAYVLVAALAIGGTIAYLQDSDSDVNVMTLGNVSIRQNEEQRVDPSKNGTLTDADIEDFKQAKPIYPYVDVNLNGAMRDDYEEITFPNGQTNKLFIGDNAIDKLVSVTNTGKTDAYVRTIVALEAPTDKIDLSFNSTDWTMDKDASKYSIEVDGVKYDLFVCVYKNVLKPGETTPYSLMQIILDGTATNEDAAAYGDTYDVLVLSQAIQTAGFADAMTALNTGFGVVDADSAAEWFNGVAIPDVIASANEAYDAFSAFDQSGKSGSVILNSDINTADADTRWSSNREYALRAAGTDVTFALNGHTVNHNTAYQDGKNTGYTYLFTTAYNGKLTVNGEGGSIYSENEDGFTCIFYAQGPSEIVINGGEYHAVAGVPVWAGNNAKVTINGGKFTSSGSDQELIYSSGGVIDIYGGFFHNTDWENRPVNVANANRGTGFINIYGGTFVNFDPSSGGDDPNNILVADGYKVVSETQANGDVWYTVVAE